MENILKERQKQNDRPLEEQDFPSDKKKKEEGRISGAHADVVVSCLLFSCRSLGSGANEYVHSPAIFFPFFSQ